MIKIDFILICSFRKIRKEIVFQYAVLNTTTYESANKKYNPLNEANKTQKSSPKSV